MCTDVNVVIQSVPVDKKLPFYFAELANSVSINGSSNPLLAGGEYSIDCLVDSDVTSTIRWMDSSQTTISNSSEYQIEGPITSGIHTILRLRFPSLKTFSGGIYYCESAVVEPQSVRNASRVINVKSKLLNYQHLGICLNSLLFLIFFFFFTLSHFSSQPKSHHHQITTQ